MNYRKLVTLSRQISTTFQIFMVPFATLYTFERGKRAVLAPQIFTRLCGTSYERPFGCLVLYTYPMVACSRRFGSIYVFDPASWNRVRLRGDVHTWVPALKSFGPPLQAATCLPRIFDSCVASWSSCERQVGASRRLRFAKCHISPLS